MIAASVQRDVDGIPKWSHAQAVEARFVERIAVLDLSSGSPPALSNSGGSVRRTDERPPRRPSQSRSNEIPGFVIDDNHDTDLAIPAFTSPFQRST